MIMIAVDHFWKWFIFESTSDTHNLISKTTESTVNGQRAEPTGWRGITSVSSLYTNRGPMTSPLTPTD